MKTSHFINFLTASVFVFLATNCSENKGSNNGNKKKGESASLVTDAVVVAPSKLEIPVFTTGNVLPNESVEVRSEISGRVTSILFSEGSPVSKGDLILKIDDRELQAQLRKLMIDKKQADDDKFRKEKLFEIKAISQEEVERARSQAEIIDAGIELLKTQISKTEIRAPFSGMVGLRQISAGSYLTPGNLITTLQQTDPLKLEFSIPEKYGRYISNGSLLKFTIEGDSRVYEAKVYAKDPSITASTRSLLARALVSNPGNLVLPGSFAKITLVTQTVSEAVVIPAEAVIPFMGGEKVFVIRDGKALSRNVTTGLRLQSTVQVVEGLLSGDTVLVSGLLMVKEGAPVKVIVKNQ